MSNLAHGLAGAAGGHSGGHSNYPPGHYPPQQGIPSSTSDYPPQQGYPPAGYSAHNKGTTTRIPTCRYPGSSAPHHGGQGHSGIGGMGGHGGILAGGAAAAAAAHMVGYGVGHGVSGYGVGHGFGASTAQAAGRIKQGKHGKHGATEAWWWYVWRESSRSGSNNNLV
ncbi:hypothetical protein MKW92_023856 [Papaver armeniacum]|nr:hypothetical protein MKW92_023856 [Papaver armeniacum]